MASTFTGRTLAGVLAALPALGFAAGTAEAAGFAIKEQSTTALGNAFAGATTGIDDLSYSFFNPAMMTYLEGQQAAASLSYINANSEFEEGSASNALGTPINTTSQFGGNEDISDDAFVPAAYVMWSANQDLKLGLSVTAPFGLVTKNPDGWIGRYHALKSDLKTYDINPMVAYRVHPALSIGGGFRAVYADVELTNAVDIGTIGASLGVPGSSPTTQDGKAKLTGDDWGFGGNAGLMFDPGKLYAPLEGLRLGVAYRSHVDLKIEGDTEFDMGSSGSVGDTLQGLGLLVDSDATAKVDLPETVNIGVNYDINERFSVMAETVWTNWSRFDQLRIKFTDDDSAQPDSVTEENWDDAWFYAVGATYRPDGQEGLALRVGLAYDESPVPEATRTPRVPDEDRYWISIGADYAPYPWFKIGLGYTHIFVDNADIDLSASDKGNASRGNLDGKYENNRIDIFALQGTFTF